MVFTPDDLMANRHGILTATQKRWLGVKHASRLVVYGCFVLISAAFCLTNISDALKGSKSDIFLLIIAASGIVTFAALVFFIFKAWCYRAEMQDGLFHSVLGRVHLTFQDSKSAPRVLQIEGLEFVIPEIAVRAFAEGGKYRIFYTPYSKMILSAERYSIEE